MTDTQALGVTSEQKDLILRGLRFVRSSISMGLVDRPSEASDEERSAQLREVDHLVGELTGKVEQTPATV